MLIKIGHHTECDTGCQADVQGDLVLDEVFSQALVVDCGDAMLDAFRTETDQRIPDALRTRGLPGVWHAPESRCTSPVEVITKHGAGKSALRSAEPEPDQSGHLMIKCDRCRQLGRRDSEVGWNVKDPPQLQTMITTSGLTSVLDRLQERLCWQVVADGDVWRHGQLGVPDVLGRHVGRYLVGDQAYVLGSLDQIYDCQIVPDEMREVIKDEEPG